MLRNKTRVMVGGGKKTLLNEVLSLNAQEYGKAIDVDCNSIPQ